ncbi:MAG TPA: coproporphyrinogen III oxidase [Chitinophagaceae bacterium]|nr:coproporphyrinogen III oxidase [Chitinophagaceae bacterium]
MAGIYIHIPFCHQACNYCNFHFSTSRSKQELFVEALLVETRLNRFALEKVSSLQTVYFGGGTPSILTALQLRRIMDALHSSYTIDPSAEITLEANPEDINPKSLADWLALGINRLSVGVQSFDDDELKWMNRRHSGGDSRRCLDEISSSGFTQYSVDLIYGSPLQSEEILMQNIEVLSGYRVPHISCYALTAELRTALQHIIQKDPSQAPDPDVQAARFGIVTSQLTSLGYEHYEISNFALTGMRSRHNSSYWSGQPYLGLGPSAHSFDGLKIRRWNIANNSLYIQSLQQGVLPFEEEILTEDQALNERVMVSIRTAEGIDLNAMREQYGSEEAGRLLSMSGPYIREGYMALEDERLKLTDAGKFLADGIAAHLFR